MIDIPNNTPFNSFKSLLLKQNITNGMSPKIIGNMLKNIKRFHFTGLEDNATAVKLLGIKPIHTVAFLGKAIACNNS